MSPPALPRSVRIERSSALSIPLHQRCGERFPLRPSELTVAIPWSFASPAMATPIFGKGSSKGGTGGSTGGRSVRKPKQPAHPTRIITGDCSAIRVAPPFSRGQRFHGPGSSPPHHFWAPTRGWPAGRDCRIRRSHPATASTTSGRRTLQRAAADRRCGRRQRRGDRPSSPMWPRGSRDERGKGAQSPRWRRARRRRRP